MFWNVLSIENTKIFKRTLLWVELALLALLVLVLNIILYSTLKFSPDGEVVPAEARAALMGTLTWPGSLLNALSFAGGNALGGLLLIVLVGAATAQEYTWRTLQLWLGRGVPRPVLLAGKFAALLLPVVLFVITPLLVGGVITAFLTVQESGGLPLERVNFLQLGLSIVRTAYTLLPYASLAFFLAVVSRSAVVAIGAGLGYSLLFEGIAIQLLALLGGNLARLGQYFPAGLSASLMELNQAAANVTVGLNAGMPVEYLAPLPAAVGILVWTLLFTGLAAWIFSKQDLTV